MHDYRLMLGSHISRSGMTGGSAAVMQTAGPHPVLMCKVYNEHGTAPIFLNAQILVSLLKRCSIRCQARAAFNPGCASGRHQRAACE